MKPIHAILALSLAASVGLAFGVARNLNHAGAASATVRDGARRTSAGAINISAAFDTASLASAFNTLDPAQLLAQLRALGVNETRARDFANRFIWLKYDTRRRELLAAKNAGENPLNERAALGWLTTDERRELRELANAASRESLALLGSATVDGIETISARYSFMPPEKVAQLQYLQRDYAEMRAEITDSAARFPMPSDAAQLKILDSEFRNDLAGLLTPEELFDYDMRFSRMASIARPFLANIEMTEAEHRGVYAILADQVAKNGYYDDPMNAEQRRAWVAGAEKVAASISELLGEERGAAYLRYQTFDYLALFNVADRFNIPTETIRSVFDLRNVGSSESLRIAADNTMSPGEKGRALQDLAESIRGQVRAQLGDEIGDAYLQKNMPWIRSLASGYSVRFDTAVIHYEKVAPVAPTPPAVSSGSAKAKVKNGVRVGK